MLNRLNSAISKSVGNKEVVLVYDPEFKGNVLLLAESCHVWILQTVGNERLISDVWAVGKGLNLCEINRFPDFYPGDFEKSLEDILKAIDFHYFPYPGIGIFGVKPTKALGEFLESLGFTLTEKFLDGFSAKLNVAARQGVNVSTQLF